MASKKPKTDRAGRVRHSNLPTGGPSRPPEPPKALAASDILAAVTKLNGERESDTRAVAAIALAWRGGLTMGEVLALQDRDYNDGVVTVRGRAAREVTLDEWGRDRVEKWLEQRKQYPVGYLLCVMRGVTAGMNVLSAQISNDLNHVGLRMIDLRATRAAELAENGMTPDQIKAILGNSGGIQSTSSESDAATVRITLAQAREYQRLRDMAQTIIPYADPDPEGKRRPHRLVLMEAAQAARKAISGS